jgi:hypothetical protein
MTWWSPAVPAKATLDGTRERGAMTGQIRVVFVLDNSVNYHTLVFVEETRSVFTGGKIEGGRLEALLRPEEMAFGSDVAAWDLLNPEGRERFRGFLETLRAEAGDLAKIFVSSPDLGLARAVPVTVIRDVQAMPGLGLTPYRSTPEGGDREPISSECR